MKLGKLIAGLGVQVTRDAQEIEITGLSSHSKQVFFGNLFIAKEGCLEAHIEEAIANGASVVITEVYNPLFPKDVIQLTLSKIDEIEIELAKRFYQEPAQELYMIGITGTSGKTTTSYLVRHLLCSQQSLKVGLIGTNEYIIDNRSLPSMWTTPDLLLCQRYLRDMVKSHCSHAVMEVSSHALSQNRVALIDFDLAIFTNLTQDHFDYHKDFENYFAAKSLLFRNLSEKGIALLPDEGIWAERLKQMTKAKVITYGFSEKAEIRATDLRLTLAGSRFLLHFQGKSVEIEMPLLGSFNVLNYLAAGALLVQGYALADLIVPSRCLPPVGGRLERVKNDKDLKVFVDYAHKPHALESVLQQLRPFTEGRLIVVFGCGGLRDQGKRPLMGAIAERYADLVVVTSDNPRTEEPEKIIEAILSGIGDRNKCLVEVHRHLAIAKALKAATSKDLILIAGKGHETYQVFAHKTIDFDDRVHVATLLNEG